MSEFSVEDLDALEFDASQLDEMEAPAEQPVQPMALDESALFRARAAEDIRQAIPAGMKDFASSVGNAASAFGDGMSQLGQMATQSRPTQTYQDTLYGRQTKAPAPKAPVQLNDVEVINGIEYVRQGNKYVKVKPPGGGRAPQSVQDDLKRFHEVASESYLMNAPDLGFERPNSAVSREDIVNEKAMALSALQQILRDDPSDQYGQADYNTRRAIQMAKELQRRRWRGM